MTLLALLIVPLAAGLLCLLSGRRKIMEATNLAAAALVLGVAALLASEVVGRGPVSLWNGFLYADAFSALVVLLTGFVYLASSVYAVGYFRADDVEPEKLHKYYSLTPVFVFSMLLVAVANNLGVMWVAIEGTTLASVFLVTFYGRPTSLEAAWKYAIIGGVGLSMALFGTILTYYSAYRVSGVESLSGLNWSVLVAEASRFDKVTMRLAFVLVLLGYGTKAGLAPMHTWKPDAYSEAPAPVAAMLAAGVLNCALYGLTRFYVLCAQCLGPRFASELLILFGILSIGVAVPFVLVQKSFRRLLAYSSIDHGGIMVLGLGFGGVFGVLGMLLHMTFHTLAKPLLFFCAGNLQQHLKTDLFKRARGGVIHSLPVSGAAFLFASLAVTGSPPFSLFQSEFIIFRAGVARGRTLELVLFVAFLALIFSGFLAHIARLVLGPDEGDPRGDTCPWKKTAVIGLAALVVLIGFWLPAPLYALIVKAGEVIRRTS